MMTFAVMLAALSCAVVFAADFEQRPILQHTIDSDDGSLCGSMRFSCVGVKKCVSQNKVCDGNNDCGDNSDEHNDCPAQNQPMISQHTIDSDDGSLCGSWRFSCVGVKKCVSQSKVCDGNNDCGDNSDEHDCPAQNQPMISQHAIDSDDGSLCGSTPFSCQSVKKCVSHDRVCDGHDDCGDNSDEYHKDDCPAFIVYAMRMIYGYRTS